MSQSTVSVPENPHPWIVGNEIGHLKATADDLWDRVAVLERRNHDTFDTLRLEVLNLAEQNRQLAEREWQELRQERERLEELAVKVSKDMADYFRIAEIQCKKNMEEYFQNAEINLRQAIPLTMWHAAEEAGPTTRKSLRRL
jgi:uncharacterized protein YcaQ